MQVINPKALFPEGRSCRAASCSMPSTRARRSMSGMCNQYSIWKQDGCGPSAVVPLGADFGITCYDSGQIVVISADGKNLKSLMPMRAGQSFRDPMTVHPMARGEPTSHCPVHGKPGRSSGGSFTSRQTAS